MDQINSLSRPRRDSHDSNSSDEMRMAAGQNTVFDNQIIDINEGDDMEFEP